MSMTSTAVQNLVEIRPWGASEQIGEILTIFRFLFIPLFKQLTYRSDRSPYFHAWWLKWRGLTQGCAFLALVDIAAHLVDQIAQKPRFGGGGENRHFPAKCAKDWNVHITKATASIITKFCRMIETSKYSLWVVQIYSKQIQDGGLKGYIFQPSPLGRPTP